MKKALYIAAALVVMASCQKKEKELVIADHGPTQTVQYDQSALMGSVVNFSVNLQDNIALSTLKVALLFDEAVVADTTIRTKANGLYEGYLKVPFAKNIPDGVATLNVTSQNIEFGLTEQEFDVAVSRPDFAYLTLIGEDGRTWKMNKASRNVYSATDAFPMELNATIVTAPIDEAGRTITFGFSGSAGIDPSAKGLIPFASAGSPYTVTFNTLTWEGSPFVEIFLNGTQANMQDAAHFVAVVNLKKGDQMALDGTPFGIEDVNLDPDFFTEDARFAAADGLYKVTIDLEAKYLLVERMASATDYATLATHAVWCIGENYGKPERFAETWNTDRGLCLAEVADNVYQITFVAGSQLSAGENLNIKFFHQKGWGGEFGGGHISTVGGGLVYAGESDGNIHLVEGQKLEYGGIYRFSLDLNAYDGTTGAVLTAEKVGQEEVETDEITFGGVSAGLAGANVYEAVASLTQGQAVAVTGIPDIAAYRIDPDFFETVSPGNYTLLPVSGYYKAIIDQNTKYISVVRTTESGSLMTLGADGTGAVWMIGDTCFGKPEIFSAGWNTDLALCFAEISPKVFQLTLEAGRELSASSINVKLFHQKGWGGEFGGGSYASVDSDLIYAGESDGNIHLVSGKTLEIGAPYRFTLDLTGFDGTSGAVLKFQKAGESQVVADEITVNGAKLDLIGDEQYAGIASFTQGGAITPTGVSDLSSYWIDPDFVSGTSFAAVSGDYRVTLNKKEKTVHFRRVKGDGSAPNLEEGGLYIQGWGVASYQMTAQVGWPGAGGYQMAQVAPGVYQMTGIAVAETDPLPGGRFRIDYISAKWFFQDGWGGEATKGLTFGGNAGYLLSQGDDGNLGLSADLEEGATYRLTVDFSGATVSGSSVTAGSETVTFEKL